MSHRDLSVQLYSVREHIAADLPGTLQRIAGIGYTRVELFNFVDNADAYVAELPAAGLTAPTAHARLVGQDTARIFAAARSIGVETVIDPHIDDARWTTRDDVAGIAADLNALAKEAAEHGLTVGYHNHAFELENRIDGVSALEVLADSLDDSVSLELDTYWAAVGGEDVLPLLARLGRRVQFMHIKDGPLTKDDKEQVAVGSGRMPVVDILAAAPHALAVVELDDFTGDVFDAVADSYTYLNGLNSK
ncbi:sugar phosphate isomerase/epimerase family protein [Planctomonas psychrotolerans]|uniref:sugar phosphate isomerase/epimerase family protein n=1 Tax=Planctomonas psychrotolerans TaxID=2528712 RepID=UPI00123AB0B2|nr:sugar phosphate isomerase/epimerase [Planctomonas psychrotolerans]